MSAGLMSCVRENSPPLDSGDGTTETHHTDFDGSSPPPLPPDTPGKYIHIS